MLEACIESGGRPTTFQHLARAELLRLRTSAGPEEQTRVQPMLREKMAPLQAPEYASWAVQALRHTVDYVVGQPGVVDRLAVVAPLRR